MSGINKAILLVAGLALAACSDARWDDTNAGNGGTGIGGGSTADQSSISPEAQGILDGQARWLTANPAYVVTIEGHADERGTREYNLALGARRANSAREYLISQGVAASRIQTVSYGKERPIEICSEQSCYNKNRRAVTVLAGGAVS